LQGLSHLSAELPGVEEELSEMARSLANATLNKWDDDPHLAGSYVITLIDQDNLEVEIRKRGQVEILDRDQLRKNVLRAAETHNCGWDCIPSGYGYPLRFKEELLGLCILFPEREVSPLDRWEQEALTLAAKLGPVLSSNVTDPPSLSTLVDAIPERSGPEVGEVPKKLHWEKSKTRVQVPVQQELADYLLTDFMPLF